MSESMSIQADANQVLLMLKSWIGSKWFVILKKIGSDLKINTIEVKDYILLTESNKCQMPGS